MNNRYFIQIKVSCSKAETETTLLDWYDNPDELIKNMKQQFNIAVYDLASKRGKFMKKLEKKGPNWFKKNTGKLFDCSIKVIRFNHSFDNNNEFNEWLKDNNIIPTDNYVLSGSLVQRKALQDYAVDYYIDWYDANFNLIETTSYIHGESIDHRRSGKIFKCKPGDHIRYEPHGNTDYLVTSVPDAYSSLYWHYGRINVHDINDPDIAIGEFDLPKYLHISIER